MAKILCFHTIMLPKNDAIVRDKSDIEIALDVVDKGVLVGILGIEAELCNTCRAIWKKLQKRRLGRGY